MEKVGQVWIKLWPLNIEGINGWEGIRPSILWGFGRIYSVKLLTLWLGCLDFSPKLRDAYLFMSGKQLGEHLEVLRCCACFLGGSGEFEDIHPLRTSHGSWFMLRYVRRSKKLGKWTLCIGWQACGWPIRTIAGSKEQVLGMIHLAIRKALQLHPDSRLTVTEVGGNLSKMWCWEGEMWHDALSLRGSLDKDGPLQVAWGV